MENRFKGNEEKGMSGVCWVCVGDVLGMCCVCVWGVFGIMLGSFGRTYTNCFIIDLLNVVKMFVLCLITMLLKQSLC